MDRLLAWTVFGAWLVWLHALQAWLAGGGSLWVPDLALVLVFSLLARLEAKDAMLLVLVATVARAALAVEPGVALGAGLLGTVMLVLAARGVFELTTPAWRTLFCGGMVFAFDAWLAVVHALRAEAPGALASLPRSMAALVPIAFVSAVASLVLGPALAHLPGLSPLRRRRW